MSAGVPIPRGAKPNEVDRDRRVADPGRRDPGGAHCRIDPSLDLFKLDMPPMTRAMAEAAQKYGIIATNQTGSGLCFWAEDPSQYGVDYKAATLGLYPTQYLRSFPWKHLQLLKMHLTKASHLD